MILVEAIACSADDAVIAEAAGVHRLEVCSSMALGGLTPTIGTLKTIRSACSLPLMAMVRPRQSGFCYTSNEFASMLADAAALIESGADGIVFGILTDTGEIDAHRCGQLVLAAGSKSTVFHRAFDATPDPFRSLEILIGLGFSRVLTSGQALTALQGAGVIRRMIETSRHRIEIIPGGGVRPETVKEIVVLSGANQVHLGPFQPHEDPSTELAAVLAQTYGSAYPVADGETLAKVVELVSDQHI